MILHRFRAKSAWIGLLAVPAMLCATTARANTIPSQLSGIRDHATVCSELARSLAVQRLISLGFMEREAHGLVEATLESEAGTLLRDAIQLTEVDGRLRVMLRRDSLREFAERFRDALAARDLAQAQVERRLRDRLISDRDAMTPFDHREQLLNLGFVPGEADALVAALSDTELIWVYEQGPEGLPYAGKIVGVNWTGLLLLAVPLVIIGVVAAAGSGSGAGAIAAAGLVAGLVLVLFADPAFIFGSKDGGP